MTKGMSVNLSQTHCEYKGHHFLVYSKGLNKQAELKQWYTIYVK